MASGNKSASRQVPGGAKVRGVTFHNWVTIRSSGSDHSDELNLDYESAKK